MVDTPDRISDEVQTADRHVYKRVLVGCCRFRDKISSDH